MPALGEYLGVLLAEVTKARLQADLESARIAELYASHPLLQHMPVPRFRLPNVALDLPVAVEKIDQPSGTTTLPEQLPVLRQKVDGIIEQELNQQKIHLTPSLRKRLTNNLNDLFDKLKTSPAISASQALAASADAVSSVMEVVKGADAPAPDPTLESSLRKQFDAEFLKLQPPPPQVQVLVITAQLKDIAPPLALTRIRLTISEEGVEWTQTNPDDPLSKTLLPE